MIARASAIVLVATPALAGCTSPNTYATARTLAPGDVTHTVAVEAIAFHGTQGTGALPVFPTYVFRVGVIDHVDVGARIGNLTELGADVKVNLVQGRVDLAIAGGAESFLEWHYEPHGDRPPRRTGARAYFHLPFIVAYNVSKKLSLVGAPGIAYVVGRDVSDDSIRTQPFGGGTLAARLGLGIDYRWNERRAVHPEVTLLQSTRAAETIVMFGVGFNFGSLPKYEDLGDPAPLPGPPPAPPRPPPAPPSPAPGPPSGAPPADAKPDVPADPPPADPARNAPSQPSRSPSDQPIF